MTAGEETALDLVEDLWAFLGPEEAGGPPVLEFPAWETAPAEDVAPSPRILRRRLQAVQRLAAGAAPVIVASVAALLQPVPDPGLVRSSVVAIAVSRTLPPERVLADLVNAGFDRVDMVASPGEASRRGGIVDVFPRTEDHPVRIEFFGDEVESIRIFDPESQRSIREIGEVAFEALDPRKVHLPAGEGALLPDHLPAGALALVVERDEVAARAKALSEGILAAHHRGHGHLDRALTRLSRIDLAALPTGGGPGRVDLAVGGVARAAGNADEIARGVAEIRDEAGHVLLLCRREAEIPRVRAVLGEKGVREGDAIEILTGSLHHGFSAPALGIAVLTDHEVFSRYEPRREARSAPEPSADPIATFLDLEVGDLVVHARHGIGRFEGMEVLSDGKSRPREYLKLIYRNQTALYVPADRIDLVQKYVGAGGVRPSLDVIGGVRFSKSRARARVAAEELATELLRIHAERAAREAPPFPPEDPWVAELEASFPYPETADQTRIAGEIRGDLVRPRPMDRLICGDVGYGKTELAVRAAFRAATAGYQVAVLVPTTVLCQQHVRTFRDRMAGYPVTLAALSRFESDREQKRVLAGLAGGSIDVCIGTHRLLSKDVVWKNLGLVIVDEEQRFGVAAKTALTKLRATVHVLTLSATPIPRTLHMALAGIRDISTMETAPRGRLAIQTTIVPPEATLIREAILRELARDGQVFFIHNRVQTIAARTRELARIVPEARLVYAHGQMKEDLIAERMAGFLDGRSDVLVTTTIIESGVDIPRVNTILVDRADRFGLADLHQLRGRVGRSRHRAYCYLLLPERGSVTDKARERLRAIEEFDELGAGFRIAMRDLEIRGAGNLLGPEQSGHIQGVGYEMYCSLLRRAVKRLRGEAEEPDVRGLPLDIALDIEMAIPDDYVPDPAQKLEIYRTLANAATPEAVLAVRADLRDRFGPPPPSVILLLDACELRVRARDLGVRRVGRDRKMAVLELRKGARPDALRTVAGPRFRLPAPGLVHILLEDPEADDTAALAFLLRLLAGRRGVPAAHGGTKGEARASRAEPATRGRRP